MAHLRRRRDGGAGGDMRMFAQVWVEEATRKIRFKPDRAAVARELLGHIQDLQEKYKGQGLSPYDAEMQATEDMGDPAAIADELGRLHRPYWGWLWRLSQWTLGILLAWAIFTWIGGAYSRLDGPGQRALPSLPDTTETWSANAGVWTRRLLDNRTVDGSIKLGNYRFTVPLAYLLETTYEGARTDLPSVQYELTICLQAETWHLWEPINASQYMILSHEAVNSSGNRYGRWEPGLFSEETHRSYFCNTYNDLRQTGRLNTWFEIQMDVPDGVMPDWVDIPIGYGDERLRINFKEGVVEP